MVSQGEMESKDHLDHQEKMDHQDPPDLNLEGPPTPGGGRALVLNLKVLSYSTQGSLEGHSTPMEGGGSNYICMPKDPEYSTTLTYQLRWSKRSCSYTWSRI